MACYIKAKLTPISVFSKKLLSSPISSRPSTCLAALKQESYEAWSPAPHPPKYNQTTYLEDTNSSNGNSDIISLDHTNRYGHSSWLQVHFQLVNKQETTYNTTVTPPSDKILNVNAENDIQETDKQEIMNFLFDNCKNVQNRPQFLKSAESMPLQNFVALPPNIYCLEINPREKSPTVFFQTQDSLQNATGISETKDFGQKPTNEQLTKILNDLSQTLPRFFTEIHNYQLYHKDLVFQNGIRNITTRGINAYIQHISWMKVLCHLKYAHVKFHVLKITKHEEDGTIRVRWRISGVSGIRSFFFWNFKLWHLKKNINTEAEWIDGFSIFHVGVDGLVYKHMCDKMMPDENREPVQSENVGGLKLAMMLGLTLEGTTLGDFPMCSTQNA